MAQRYLVTARKYRPQLFKELVAQEHVTETLLNAIRMDRLAHAYLFSGPRGVGKTTAARIVAKAINCTTPLADREQEGEPCRQCESCRSFEESRNLNIIEIDAASNNKVEDIRELRDTVLVPPQGNAKKVYIVDEVHMLSNAAFNALLKTLEEPPPYVLFIFATTEPHKVLPTILSRCQRFDFRRIAVPEIVAMLDTICAEEGITADEASRVLIAQKGDGAMRDALSAFDQAVSLCGNTISYSELARAFGVVEIDLFFETTQCAVDGSSAGMLNLVEKIMRAGYDLQEYLSGLATHTRNLLVACSLPDPSLIEAPQAIQEKYVQIAQHLTETDLLRHLMLIGNGEEKLRSSTNPRLQVELTLLKLAGLAHTMDLRALISRIEELENTAPDSRPASPPPQSEPPPPKPVSVAPTAPEPAPLPAEPEAPPPERPEPKPVERPESEPPEPIPPKQETGPAPERSAPASSPQPPESGKAPSLFGTPALRTVKRPPSDDNPQALIDGSTALATMAEPATAVASPELEQINQCWEVMLEEVKELRIHVAALLQHAVPLTLEADVCVCGVPDDFHRRMLQNQETFLVEQLQPRVKLAVNKMRFVITDTPPPVVDEQQTTETDPHAYMKKLRAENPVVRAIFDQFGGEIVW